MLGVEWRSDCTNFANEFVGWFNSVDAQYRLDLRDMLDQRFGRQDAWLDQRFATQDARIEQRLTAFEAHVDQRLTALDAKLESRLTVFEQRLGILEARLDGRFESLEGRLLGHLETRLAGVRSEMQRWIIASWSSMMLVLLGTLLAVLKTR